MKTFVILLTLTLALSADCLARAVRVLDMKSLLAGSELVLVGRVKSVVPSGKTVELSYPTWKGAAFEWLKVEVEVVEPIKGTKKGEIVRTLMLSTRVPGSLTNPPGMVEPKVGDNYLLCLLPTKYKGVYASITAPFDDDQGIFVLDRMHWDYSSFRKDPKHFDKFPEFGERYKAIWSLVDENGQLTPNGADELREKYKTEIATAAPEGAVISLEWKKETSPDGWEWNVPVDTKNPPANPLGSVAKPE